MSGDRTQSELSRAALAGYLKVRDAVRTQRIGGGGRDVCAALTDELDSCIAALASSLPEIDRLAVVAVGGYGRQELSLFSDVDLMVLHDVEDPGPLAAAIFRPLWDAGLRVGHSVRTVKEASAAAKSHVETHTSLLSARLVAGDEALFGRFSEALRGVTRARPLTSHLVSDEWDRWSREPFLLMAADVKSGRGGLRTLHGFAWERRREELIGRFGPEMTLKEDAAWEALLQTRNALHAAAGRRHDVYSLDLREQAAHWLGMDTKAGAELLVAARIDVDALSSARWSELATGIARPRSRRRNRSVDSQTAAQRDLVSVDGFISLLESGREGRMQVERLRGQPRWEALLPQWEAIRTAPSMAPFHEHPVESHLWRTVSEMIALIESPEEPFASIADELDARESLLLAAFLHDIGKGQGADHSELGAQIAEAFCRGIGAAQSLSESVQAAVLHHLLLSETAMRRDLDDPAVIDEVAEIVADLPSLQVLYLLTVADLRATGSTMWTKWRASLLRTLFVRVASRFGAEEAIGVGQPISPSVIDRHLAAMPDRYRRSFDVADVRRHVRLIQHSAGSVGVDVAREAEFQSAVIVGSNGPLLRSAATRAFAANGIDVLQAQLHTRDDGLIVDVFVVKRDVGDELVGDDVWKVVREDITSILAGEPDPASRLERRIAAYENGEGWRSATRAIVSTDSATDSLMIRVECADRVGRLAEIVSVLQSLGFEIRLAKVETRGDQVVDTFHVAGDRTPQLDSFGALEQQIEALLSR